MMVLELAGHDEMDDTEIVLPAVTDVHAPPGNVGNNAVQVWESATKGMQSVTTTVVSVEIKVECHPITLPGICDLYAKLNIVWKASYCYQLFLFA
jgi:hypothetical protein